MMQLNMAYLLIKLRFQITSNTPSVFGPRYKKLSSSSLKQFYFAYLSESLDAYQHLFNYCIYVFTSHVSIEKDYSNPSVLAIAQWTKRSGERSIKWRLLFGLRKPKMSFLSLVRPDFNVLPLIQPHFKRRYQDQRWLIYDEQRKFEFIMIYGNT